MDGWTDGALTCHCVSVHVIKHISEAEYPGCRYRRLALEQRRAEFLPRSTGAQIGAGAECRAHAAGQGAHLVRAAAAL